MAKSINFRSFTTDSGTRVSFSPLKFRNQLDEYVRNKRDAGEKCTKEELYQMIATSACVSPEAVKNWRSGHNGVGDVQTIKKIAHVLDISYEDLVVNTDNMLKQKIEQDFEPSFSNEKDLVIQLHKLFVDYLYWFSGTDYKCYADTVLESPDKEQEKYVANLYHFLDSIALSISEDTYNKLRIIITQLDQYYLTDPHIFPSLWIKLNPILSTEVFMEFSMYDSELLCDFLPEDSEMFDCEPLYHMLFEDFPEYKKEYDKLKMDKTLAPFNVLENSLPGRRNYYWAVKSYALIQRELSNTLIKVMKYYFPEYFGQLKQNKPDK